MNEIIVNGGEPLFGVLEPQGSKNAALPIIFATLITHGISIITGVPDIGDVRIAIKLIESYGAVVDRMGDTLTVNTENVKYTRPPKSLTSSIRASSYLIGASLSKFGIFHLSEFGGCNFCNRPTDMHIACAVALGAREDMGALVTGGLKGAHVVFDKISVGATINALIMSSAAEGTTVIEGVAKEPHVKALVDFLVSAGAKIYEAENCFVVEGTSLHGGSTNVIGDMIEAGTYLLMAPVTGGSITVKGAATLGLESFFSARTESGISVLVEGNDVTVCGSPFRPINIRTSPYPGYPTDLQPQIAPLMAVFHGGKIEETVWQNRFSYLDCLDSFKLLRSSSASFAEIYPSKLSAASVSAPDLRGGAAALICALAAKGESEIKNAELISRGYSNVVDKLTMLGAKIYYKN